MPRDLGPPITSTEDCLQKPICQRLKDFDLSFAMGSGRFRM